MNINNALNVLGLEGMATLEEVKRAYKKSAFKYHPDRNPAGLEMMKIINVAYSSLIEFFNKNPDLSEVHSMGEDEIYDYGEAINNALNAIFNLQGLIIEICGAWVWVSGETKDHKDTLKSAGFKWAKKKVMWYFRPESKKRRSYNGTMSIEEIRENYGSKKFYGSRKELSI